ncbi:MAG: phage antirepressor KilAC domain-containing protein [Gammaproteobacteria bacterium]|nr:phage antirepressor KilAC domain-containing protein [Gammaproteobacteria bacterium]
MNKQATYSLKDAAKRLGVGQRKFYAFLREQGVIFKQGAEHLPRPEFVTKGFLSTHISTYVHPIHGEQARTKTIVTTSGLIWLKELTDTKLPITEEKAA